MAVRKSVQRHGRVRSAVCDKPQPCPMTLGVVDKYRLLASPNRCDLGPCSPRSAPCVEVEADLRAAESEILVITENDKAIRYCPPAAAEILDVAQHDLATLRQQLGL